MVRKEVEIMTLNKPYFMNNKDWYYFDEKKFRYILTDKAPNEAIKSYGEYYRLLKEKKNENIVI